MLLLLVRHGHGPHVGKRLPTGESPLSKQGLQQADELVARFEGVRLDSVVSSPMQRAKQTGTPLARARRLKIKTYPGLGDVRYGKLGGKTLKQVFKGDIPGRLAIWPTDVRFPDGETLRETQLRGVEVVEQLRVGHAGKVVAAFSHGDPIRLILAHYLGVHADLFRRIAIDPVGVSAIDLRGGMPQIRRINDTGSLRDLAPEQA
ncbi:MAG: histidine phosphatase family protein [Actinomycetota bacterium]